MTSLAQAKRAANVSAEAWFDVAHERYRVQGKAVIARCHFPVRGAPKHMYPIGGGDADFVGLARMPDTGDSFPGYVPEPREDVYPVAFDLKVNRHASFKIDPRPKEQGGKPEVIRQVRLLLDFWSTGGIGFLALLDPPAGELWMLGQRPLTWLLEHLNQFYKYRAHVGEVWEPEVSARAGVVCVKEADTLTLARTGIRYDWLAHLSEL